MRRAILTTAVTLGAVATVVPSPAAFADHPRYRLVDLGGISGGGRDSSNAYAVNERGQVVGWATRPDPLLPSNDIGRAFLWTPNGPDFTGGTMQDLGILPGAPGHSAALGINDAGQLVGYSGTGERSRAFLWQPAAPGATAGVMRDLGELPGGSDNSRAFGINRGGQITGYADTADGRRPFLWNPAVPNSSAGSLTDLGLPFAGIRNADAFAINDRGQVLGTASGAYAGFLWTPDTPGGASGAFRGFGPPPQPFDGRLETGLNDSGQVAGAVFGTVQNERASVWTPNSPGSLTGTTALIGDPLNGYLYNWAKAINDGGTVVGTMFGTTGGGPPTPGSTGLFIWSAEDGMADLVSLVDGLPINWTLLDAVDINNAGMIVGSGSYDPDGPSGGAQPLPRGYLLVPVPEPGAVALALGWGGLALLTRRRRRD